MSALLDFVRCHLVAIILVGLVAYGIVYREEILRSEEQAVAAVGTAQPDLQGEAALEMKADSAQAAEQVSPEPASAGMDIARKAYWEGNLEEAIETYRQLIAEHPDQADFLGELGDVYYQQGNKEAAGEVYYNAGLLLIEQENKARAERVLAVLRLMNSPYADELARRLKG